ncbi:MAG: D-alanine--D-alanine ligase family protein [Patescibacteria group bacterium]|jgi:D-alanine-D-alanine ligase
MASGKRRKTNLAIIFGSRSPEHEVSIVSALQALDWIDKQKYSPLLIYLDRENQAFWCPPFKTGSYRNFIKQTLKKNRRLDFIKGGAEEKKLLRSKKMPIDVALLIMHGAYGEDGRIQGLLDFYDIPYTSCGVLGSALGQDKVITKNIFSSVGLAIMPYFWFWSKQFKKNPKLITRRIKSAKLYYPLFVKPAGAGSSVGISRVVKAADFTKAVLLAARYDNKIVVEQGLKGALDINCAVMGGYDPEVSVCEQPISDDQFLSFEEKYLKGGKTKGMAGLSRLVPAPIPDKTSQKIQKMALKAFSCLNCWGMVRMDFLYQKKTGAVYINEVNTIPGSLSFYLWQASGLAPGKMIDRLVKLAREKAKQTDSLSYFFDSPLLDQK